MKNCSDLGDILQFKNISDYEKYIKDNRRIMWIYLRLKVFRVPGFGMKLFGVFICPQCELMSSLDALEVSQSPEDIRMKLCMHSLVASMMIGNWREFWEISMSVGFEHYEVLCNQDEKYATFVKQTSETPLLAGMIDKKKILLLYCSTPRQEVPFCTSCVRRKCFHYKQYVAFNLAQENENQEEELCDYDIEYDEEEGDYGIEDHYMTKLPKHTRGFLYGYNFSPIHYPFSTESGLQSVWIDRRNGRLDLPESLIPIFSSENRCKHDFLFNSSVESLVTESKNSCVYNEVGERVFPCQVFARPTVGPCNCLQRFDGHHLLLWNLGKLSIRLYTLPFSTPNIKVFPLTSI